jgi:competence protein ComEC
LTRPPPILLIAISYGAGLATGLARFPDLPLIIAVLFLIAVVLQHGEWWWPALPAIAAGIVAGSLARTGSAQWCAARLPLGEQRYTVRSVDPGEGTGRVLMTGLRCTGVVTAWWPPSAEVPAGATLRVTARWAPTDRALGRPAGLLLINTLDSIRVTPTAVERTRTAMARSARALFGPRAPLVDALVGGWRGEIDPDLRGAFASAGLMHLLAISGFHIVWLAGWVLLILRLCRVERHPAECGAAIAVLGYAAFLGWPAAATRAAILLLAAAFCRWRQRQVRGAALVGVSIATVLITDPWAISDAGAWLSVLGLSGVVAAVRWSDRTLGPAWWIRSLSGSTGALIATAPLTAAVFGQVAPIGLVLNLVGMPLLLAILPAVFAPLVLHAALPSIAAAIAASGNGLLALLELLVRIGARAPGAGVPGADGARTALPWLAVLLAAGWVIHGRTTLGEAVRRCGWIVTAALCFTVIVKPGRLVADDHRLTLLFLDVGQGDAALIRTPGGHWIEVDAGPVGEGRDAGRRVVVPLLTRQGVDRIDLFVLSHAHRDHVGGGAAVLAQVPVSLAIEPGELFADSAYDDWLAALAAHHTRWRAARAGVTWALDGVSFRILHPPTPWAREGEDLNEDSVVLELSYGDFRALLMGDAGFVAESAMAAGLRSANVLKVGHHGSRTASSAGFLAAVHPQAAIVSVGRNGYGHPSPEALDRLGAAQVAVWRTDREGTVTVSTDGRTFTVKGVRAAAVFGTSH